MPRQTVAAPAPVERHGDVLVASAAFMPRIERKRNYRKPEAWQEAAWSFYDTIGELRYATTWFANALSRARLLPARRDAKGVVQPEESGPAHEALATIFGGIDSQAQMLKAMGQHYFVAGEWYLVGRGADADDETTNSEVWEVVGTNEIKRVSQRWYIDYGNGDKIELADSDAILRMWLPHPKRRAYPDSPVKAVLGSLSEIELLTRHISAQVRSRLAGAGLLLMPNEMSFAAPDSPGIASAVANGADPFMATLGMAMVTAIDDPGDPSALVPIIARVPGEHVGNVRHLTFWSDLDQQAIPQREAAIRRTALGLELPPEVLMGTAEVNHWGAWQIDESAIKAHIEPALAVISAAITPALRKVTGDEEVFVVADTSELRLRPNRSKEAIELYDRGEISSKAMRRETGFSETDLPDKGELETWMLRRIVGGYASASPNQIEEALRLLGVDFPDVEDCDSGGGYYRRRRYDRARGPKPDPSLEGHPTPGPPEDVDRASLMASCDVLVWRALERAGNRLKNYSQSRPPGIQSEDLHCYVQARSTDIDKMLEGAWTALPRILERSAHHPDLIAKALDAYTRSLLTGGQPHNYDLMTSFIDKAVGSADADDQ